MVQAAKLRPLEITVDVKYLCLESLYQKEFKNLHLYTNDDTHPTKVSHYGNKKMIECLLKLDEKFGKALADGEFDTVDP